MTNPARARIVLVLAACLLALWGCSPAAESPPRLANVRVSALPARGVVTLDYELADDGGAPLLADVSFRSGEGGWRPATSYAGTGQGLGIVATPDFKPYAFAWDSTHDLPGFRGAVALRIAVRNPTGQASAESQSFLLHNDNHAPEASFDAIAHAAPDGKVVVSVRFLDADADALTLSLDYSLNQGADYAPATLASAATFYESAPGGRLHTLTWNALADLGAGSHSGLRLRATLGDAYGKGPRAESASFSQNLAAATSFDLAELGASLRDVAPLTLTLYGKRDAFFSLSVSYRLAPSDAWRSCTQRMRERDATRFLSASPEGESVVFYWDTKKDVSAAVARGVGLRVELLDEFAQSLVSPLAVETEVGIDNGEKMLIPQLSEIYPGIDGEGGFIELAGPPGFKLDGLRLYEVWPDGSNGLATGQAVVSLDGYVLGSKGSFVIAGATGPQADLVAANFVTFFKAGRSSPPTRPLPNNLILDRPEYEAVYDALGYGDFQSMGYTFQGQGTPSPAPPLGASLNRDYANISSHDNSLDFIIESPSPGEARLYSGN